MPGGGLSGGGFAPPGIVGGVVACLHTFVFAAYPVLLVVSSNAGVVPLEAAEVARAIAVSVALNGALLVLTRPVVPDLAARAACLSVTFILFSLYTLAAGTSAHPAIAALYIGIGLSASALIVKPWSNRRRSSAVLNLAAAVLLSVNLYGARPLWGPNAWRPAADALIAEVLSAPGGSPDRPQPDIYYIVLDGFGRPDVLEESYGLDLAPFVGALESRGFVVPPAGRSNYAQTFLSLASSLNLSYLDDLTSGMIDSPDRRSLDYLIQHNALFALAARAGYRTVAVGSNYAATARLRSADECHCTQYGLGELEAAALNLTPLRAFIPVRWTHDAHRRKIQDALDALHGVAARPGPPHLVFAHILAPHPPFVFGSDGHARPAAGLFGFQDGNHYHGPRAEYVEGYREQARFIAARVLTLVDILLNRPGPPPVVILQGDHGPGADWNWDDLRDANSRERLAIFSAYYLPGDERPRLSPHITPVNGLRVMANRYLGSALPLLSDVSFVSSWGRPYDLALVPPEQPHARRVAH